MKKKLSNDNHLRLAMGSLNAVSRLLVLTLFLFAFLGGVKAQQPESHWPAFDYHPFEAQGALYASIMINGESVDVNYPDWDQLEVAAFVGDELRMTSAFLTDEYVIDYGELFPTLNAEPIYYTTPGETVTFKMYNHATGVEYDVCKPVIWDGDFITILTGEEHWEGFDDPDHPLMLNFISSESAPLYLIGDMNNWSRTDMIELDFNEEAQIYHFFIESSSEIRFAFATYQMTDQEAAVDQNWSTFNADYRYAIGDGDVDATGYIDGDEVQLKNGTNSGTITLPAGYYYIYVTKDYKMIISKDKYIDIFLNPEDITDGDITKALKKKIAPKGGKVGNIEIYLADGEAYTISETLTAAGNVTLKRLSGALSTGASAELATITMAESMTGDLITLSGTVDYAPKADGTDSDHKLIVSVIISGVKIFGLKGALVKDVQKTLLDELTIENAIIEVPADNKNVLDFNGQGYVGKVVVKNSTIYAKDKNTGFFAQYGSRPKNVNGDWLQEFDVQSSTFVNIAKGKNFCDMKQNGTAQNVYTIKNNIFVDCGKNGEMIVGFNKGQTSATPEWYVDANAFNWGGKDTHVAEVTKAGQKNGEVIVKNCAEGKMVFTSFETPDFGGTFMLAPGVDAIPETLGDPRWTITPGHVYALTTGTSEHCTLAFSVNDTDVDEAAEGDIVTVTATVDEGYKVSSMTAEMVTDWGSAHARRSESTGSIDLADIILTPVTGTTNQWTFTMPDGDVSVSSTVKRDLAVKTTLKLFIDGKEVTEATRLHIKKDGNGGYKPVGELSITLIDAIEGKTFTSLQQLLNVFIAPYFYKLQDDGETWEQVGIDSQTKLPDGIAPGQTYNMMLKAVAGGYYVGKTNKTPAITLFEGYEVTVPGGAYITYYRDEPLRIDNPDAELYTVASVSETAVTLSQPFDALPASTPMLIRNKGTQDASILLIPCTPPDVEVTAADEFKGTLDGIMVSDINAKAVYVLYNNMFVRTITGTIPANKSYIALPAASGARALTIGETTGVEELKDSRIEELKSGMWYSVDGLKLDGQPKRKGMYIQDGRKVVIK